MATSGHSHLVMLALCLTYMVIGPALILLNKYILQDLSFPYPMFLSGLGVLVSGIVAQLLVRFGYVQLHPTRREAVEGALWYKRVLPVGLAHAGTLAFGNTVYLFLGVGFIQMLKSFTPVIIMITAYLARIETPSRPTIASIVVISLGTAMTCSFTPQLSILGLIVMFAAEATEAIRLVLTQFLLQNLKFGVVEGQYVLAPASAFWLFLASFCYELPHMIENKAFDTISEHPATFLAASTMGLGVNFLTYFVIQATSSLTMKVLGTVRNIFTIIIGVIFYSEAVTIHEGLGYSVALIGFVGYNMSKSGYWDSLPPSSGSGNDIQKSEAYDKLQGLGLKGLAGLHTPSDDIESQNPLLGIPVVERANSSFGLGSPKKLAGSNL